MNSPDVKDSVERHALRILCNGKMHKRCAMNTVNQSELKAKTDLTLSAGKRVWASMRLISRWSKKVGQVLFPIFQPIIKRSIWNPKQNWRWNETVTARALIKTDCTNANRLSPPNEPVRAELNNIAFIGKWRHEREDVCNLILLLYIRTLGYIYIFFFLDTRFSSSLLFHLCSLSNWLQRKWNQ